MKQLVKAIMEIAEQNPRGFTVTIPDLQPVTSGWAIGHKDTQNSHGSKGLRKVLEHSLNTTQVVGGWKGYNGKFYFDTVIIEHDFETAIDLKVENKQIAIYHINTGKIM
jgi:hypothetical protein